MDETIIKAVVLDCIKTVDKLIDIKNIVTNSDNSKLLNKIETDIIEDIYTKQISTVLKEKIFTFYVCVKFDGDIIKNFYEELFFSIDNLSLDDDSKSDYNNIINSSLSYLKDNT